MFSFLVLCEFFYPCDTCTIDDSILSRFPLPMLEMLFRLPRVLVDKIGRLFLGLQDSTEKRVFVLDDVIGVSFYRNFKIYTFTILHAIIFIRLHLLLLFREVLVPSFLRGLVLYDVLGAKKFRVCQLGELISREVYIGFQS